MPDKPTSHKKILIVQFAIQDGDILENFHEIEDVLFQAFSQNNYAIVDGHDYGLGQFNIFIYPRGPWGPVVERVHAFLKLKGWLGRAVVAKGLASGRWQVVWPEGYAAQFKLS